MRKRSEDAEDRAGMPDCACGCAVRGEAAGEARKAVGVDPSIKAANLVRLRRIEGQVRGVQGMVEEDRYCADILTQISSIQAALGSVSRELMRNHLRHCVSSAVLEGEERSNQIFDELVELIHRHG